MNEQLSRLEVFVAAALSGIDATQMQDIKSMAERAIALAATADDLLNEPDRTAKPEPVKAGWITVRRPTGADGNKVGMVLSFYCNQVCMTKWSNVRDEPWMPLPADYTGPETGGEQEEI